MKKTLADRLAFLISSLGIRKPDFARRIQYTHAYLLMVLSGAKPEPGHRFINAVCHEFGVNPEWLLNGKEPVFSVPGLPLPPEWTDTVAKFLMLSNERQKV
ncbi:MAG: helix-turn-helix domain-containing protein, partial [Treponema sp.]|nr:helix-turn-helix domain-containing protein [Treponema sp.]